MIKYNEIKLNLSNNLYWPAEDTDLMIEAIKYWFSNNGGKFGEMEESINVLDMGCGPGTLSIYFADFCKKNYSKIYNNLRIIGIDISNEAIEFAKKNAKENQVYEKISFIRGDLFEPFNFSKNNYNSERFHLILFNPPYLPGEKKTINENTRSNIDLTWEGGNKGDELTIKFIKNVINYTKNGANLIFISSSFVPQKRIINSLQKKQIHILNTQKIHLFFEDIICYITKINHNTINNQ